MQFCVAILSTSKAANTNTQVPENHRNFKSLVLRYHLL